MIILGAVLALPYVWYARKRPWLFAAGLVIAAAIYVVFALVDATFFTPWARRAAFFSSPPSIRSAVVPLTNLILTRPSA